MAHTALAFDLLTNAMLNPTFTHIHETHFCMEKMKEAAEVVDTSLAACSSHEERVALVKANPDFLRTCIRYLTEGRDKDTCGAVIGNLAACTCSFRMPLLTSEDDFEQAPNMYRGIPKMGVVVSTICEALVLALSELERGRYHPSDPRAPGPRPWPIRADDLLPFGVEASLIGLQWWIHWLRAGNSDKRFALYKLIQAIVRLHDPFANALLDGEKKSRILYEFAVTDIARVLYKYNSTFVPVKPPQTPGEIREIGEPLEMIVNFFMALRSFSGIKFSVMLREKGIELAVLLTSASGTMVHFPPAWNTLRADVQKLAGLARAVAKASAPPGDDIIHSSGGYRWSRDIWDSDLANATEDDGRWVKPGKEEMFRYFERMRRTGWCANPTCPPSSDGLTPRLCTQCDFVRFCSDSCSRAAWKGDPLPHKKLCTIIATVRQRIGQEDWARMWARGFSFEDFAKVCEDKGVNPADWDAMHCAISGLENCRVLHRSMLSLDAESDRGMPSLHEAKIIWRNLYMRDHPDILARLSNRSIN